METEGFSSKRNSDSIMQNILEKTNISYVNLETLEIDPSVIKCVSEKIAREYSVIPIELNNNQLKVAMADPTNFQAIEDIRVVSGKNPVPVLASTSAIQIALDRYYTGAEIAEQAIQDFSQAIDDLNSVQVDLSNADVDSAPIVRIVNSVMSEAVRINASDIHIEPFENEIRVRMRIDGDLKETLQLPKSTLSSVVTRIKIISSLNIAETKRPQDGRAKIQVDGKVTNMRISFLPTVYGEKIVIRLLSTNTGAMSMEQIGLSPFNYTQIQKLMKISEGIILLTGPTGSGKTTTLYSILKEMNSIQKNIITLEDPVEYQMYGINQVQVNSQIGMTFASGLRSILRQDPDIIMLGEIRDGETAEIAIRSAVTGHIVLSTLHTNDTVSAIPRLVDMDIPKYMVTSAVAGIVAQRLLKKNCPRCLESYPASEEEKKLLGVQGDVTLKRGHGCPYCNQTGYKGRTAIHEVLVLTQELKSMITQNCDMDTLKAAATKNGMQTLSDSARELVLNGITTVSEMTRATYSLD